MNVDARARFYTICFLKIEVVLWCNIWNHNGLIDLRLSEFFCNLFLTDEIDRLSEFSKLSWLAFPSTAVQRLIASNPRVPIKGALGFIPQSLKIWQTRDTHWWWWMYEISHKICRWIHFLIYFHIHFLKIIHVIQRVIDFPQNISL